MSRRLAFAFLALLAFALFARPLLRGEVLVFRDHSDYFQPLRFFTAEELRNFRLPLWNAYNASGEPWLANPQTAVFYPPAWLFLVLPFSTAYVLFLCLHFVLLGCGAFLLFSRMASARGAFLGAVILMLCGPVLSLVDVSNNLTTFAWIPLVLWCAIAGAPPMACAAAIAMSFLAGEPLLAAIAAVMFAILRRKNLIDIGATAFCLCGIQLLPFLAMLAGSDRAGAVPAAEILRDSMPLSDWSHLVLPAGAMRQQFIPSVYIGLVAAVLAILGMTAAPRRKAARAAMTLVVVIVIAAAGKTLPLVGRLFTELPLTVLRYPARLVPLAALGLVVLAVLGWDRLDGLLRWRWLFLAAIVLVIADLVPHISPLLASAPFDGGAVPYASSIGRDGKMMRLMGNRFVRVGFDRSAWISGYLNLFGHRFDAWTAAPVISRRYTEAYFDALENPKAADAMSIEYVLASRRIPELPVVARAGSVFVHRNPMALPMAYWHGAAGRVVRATSLAFTTSAALIAVDAPAAGSVVLTQQMASGWRVEVDGVPARAERDGIFRSVRVSAGHHRVSWIYRPPSFFIGMLLTIVAVARMLLSSKFVKRRWHGTFFLRARKFRLMFAAS